MRKLFFFKKSKISKYILKPVICIWFVLGVSLLISCEDDSDQFNIGNQKVNIIIGQELYDSFIAKVSNGTSTDSDEYILLNATIQDALLKIDVTYSGGCEEHTFDLLWPEYTPQIYPPKLVVYLNHNARNDLCEAAISETLIVDLKGTDLNYDQATIDSLEIVVVNGFDMNNYVSTSD